MAQGLNRVALIGYASKAAETRSTNGGVLIANFQLATTEKYKDHGGNFVEKTEWHNIAAFSRTAEIVRDYVKKGSLLYLEGKLETSSWDDKESGQKRYKTQIILRNINFLSSRPAGEATAGPPSTPDADDYVDQGISDDSIPF
jgi:single-strand DNA-binding protein